MECRYIYVEHADCVIIDDNYKNEADVIFPCIIHCENVIFGLPNPEKETEKDLIVKGKMWAPDIIFN